MSEQRDNPFESPLRGATYEGAISIKDFTNKRRWGFRGKDAATTLRAEGWRLPDAPNQVVLANEQTLVMALSQREFWFLDTRTEALSEDARDDAFTDGMYPLFCQSSHAWFVVNGDQTSEMMAKLCGVDLSSDAFKVGDVAQTQMALINCIVTRHELDGEDVFSLLVDQSYAEYALEALLDARAEYL
ncbi:MAG: sarcosine oxidase subunit gamma family protein [Halieaceae bacterium]